MDCANDSLTGSRPRIAVAMSGVKVGLGRHVCWYVSCGLVRGTGVPWLWHGRCGAASVGGAKKKRSSNQQGFQTMPKLSIIYKRNYGCMLC